MRVQTFDLFWTISKRPARRGLEVFLRRCPENITITESDAGEVSISFEKSRTEVTAFALVRQNDATYHQGSFAEGACVFINKTGRMVFVVSEVSHADHVVKDMRKGRFEHIPCFAPCS